MTLGAPKSYGVKLVRGPFVRLPPHPLACENTGELKSIVKKIKAPMAADLFCGAGGLSLGLSDAGFEVVFAVDHDDEALETHRANHPGLSVNWDLADEEVIQQVAKLVRDLGITLVAGGPPCQPFSRAGRSMVRDLVQKGLREKHDERSDLWESFLRVVELARPPAVLMENVPDMALDRGMIILRAMVERLEAAGYAVEERVVETWRYGVPQFRQRLILVALRDNIRFDWPEGSPDRVSVSNAISDLPEVEGGWRPDNGDGQVAVAEEVRLELRPEDVVALHPRVPRVPDHFWVIQRSRIKALLASRGRHLFAKCDDSGDEIDRDPHPRQLLHALSE